MMLYRIDFSVVMGDMLKVLEGFHHRAAIWIVGMTAHHTTSRVYECTSVANTLENAGICPIK